MTRRTTTTATAAAAGVMCILALAAAIALAGCGGSHPKTDPSTTPTTGSTTPATSSASTSPTRPAWAAKYTDAQYADYQAALARYQDYLAHDQPWLNADPTGAAAMVREYFTADEGIYQLKLIRFNHQNRLNADRNPTLLWSQMVRYGKTAEGQPQVTMSNCMDERPVRAYEDGKLLTHGFKTPIVFVVTMRRTPAGKWVIGRIVNPGIDQVRARPCSAR